MQRKWLAVALIVGAASCAAQSGNLSDWQKLVDKKDCEGAKKLCAGFVSSKITAEQIEAQKCLANAALCGQGMMLVQGDNAGSGVQRPSFMPAAIDQSLAHLNLALKLAPQDVSLHKGRLRVLEMGARFPEMIKALDESCKIYKGKDAPGTWLGFSTELADLREYQTGLEYMRVLDKHYPNSADILGNIGGFLFWLKKPAEAIPYLQKAVVLDPKDEASAWNLARSYDLSDSPVKAEEWYERALKLQTDPAQRKESTCLYAQFLEKQVQQFARACPMEKENCPAAKQTACGAHKPAPKSSK